MGHSVDPSSKMAGPSHGSTQALLPQQNAHGQRAAAAVKHEKPKMTDGPAAKAPKLLSDNGEVKELRKRLRNAEVEHIKTLLSAQQAGEARYGDLLKELNTAEDERDQLVTSRSLLYK